MCRPLNSASSRDVSIPVIVLAEYGFHSLVFVCQSLTTMPCDAHWMSCELHRLLHYRHSICWNAVICHDDHGSRGCQTQSGLFSSTASQMPHIIKIINIRISNFCIGLMIWSHLQDLVLIYFHAVVWLVFLSTTVDESGSTALSSSTRVSCAGMNAWEDKINPRQCEWINQRNRKPKTVVLWHGKKLSNALTLCKQINIFPPLSREIFVVLCCCQTHDDDQEQSSRTLSFL